MLATLDPFGRLKPPAFTNRPVVDAKLARLARPPEPIDLRAVSSSATFDGVDRALLERPQGGRCVCNAAALGLEIHQATWLARSFQHPEIGAASTVSIPIDFKPCPSHTETVLDPVDVPRLAFRHMARAARRVARPRAGEGGARRAQRFRAAMKALTG